MIGLVLMTIFNQFNGRQVPQVRWEYPVHRRSEAGRIAKVTMEGRTHRRQPPPMAKITSYAPPDLWLVSDLLKNGVKIEARVRKKSLPS